MQMYDVLYDFNKAKAANVHANERENIQMPQYHQQILLHCSNTTALSAFTHDEKSQKYFKKGEATNAHAHGGENVHMPKHYQCILRH